MNGPLTQQVALQRQQTVPLTPNLKYSDNSKMFEDKNTLKRSNSQTELDLLNYNLLDLGGDENFCGLR